MAKIFPILFKQKATDILLNLLHAKKAVYASSLAKEIKYTYSHINSILKELEVAKLIEFEKHGRLKIISLTQKGKNVTKKIEEIKKVL